MQFTRTEIPEVVIIDPKVWGDNRGYFVETFKEELFHTHIGQTHFLQDNESLSSFGTLRGLHYQLPPYAQAKLVRVVHGSVIDVAVDIRKGSPTFGKHVAVELNDENKRQLFIPRGFAHGFAVLSEKAVFCYKVDNVYAPQHERGIIFNDPSLNINWGIPANKVILSAKDAVLPALEQADLFDYNEFPYA